MYDGWISHSEVREHYLIDFNSIFASISMCDCIPASLTKGKPSAFCWKHEAASSSQPRSVGQSWDVRTCDLVFSSRFNAQMVVHSEAV